PSCPSCPGSRIQGRVAGAGKGVRARVTAQSLESHGQVWATTDTTGRRLVITSDHGYAVSKRFSSEVEDIDAIAILRKTFGASRNKASSDPWQERFMPPIVMTVNGQHMVMGQRKWKVQGAFPDICHGGMSLLEVAVPWIEFESV
ncbi:MAG: hypothetical protein HGA74_17295, partial [Deltaproteobacteria bacterium]|nr:hypothetical protein [Deltaproteobacteria bacterium]